MSDLLTHIASYKRDEIARARRERPLEVVRRAAAAAPPPRGFVAAVRSRLDRGGVAVIGEIKKTSPSKGLIRADFDPAYLATAYADGGATCLSVLTDTPSFEGDLAHLAAARAAGPLPVLRKDFTLDPYQVHEARAAGADCILIILSMVDDETAGRIEDAAMDLGMDVLVEIHDDGELARSRRLRSPLIGINNRDLATFETTLATTERLAPQVPPGRTVVSESGIRDRHDVDRLRRVGVGAFLIGEHLMRRPDVAAATRELVEAAGGHGSVG